MICKLLIACLLFKAPLFSQIPVKADQLQALLDSNDIKNKANIGTKFLPFEARGVNDDTFTNSSLKNKITLINFWFSTCAPCIAEFPELRRLHETLKHNPRFQVVGLTYESPGSVKKSTEKYDLPYPILLVSRELCDELSFHNGYPTSILTGMNGEILYIDIGGPTDIAQVKAKFQLEVLPRIMTALGTL